MWVSIVALVISLLLLVALLRLTGRSVKAKDELFLQILRLQESEALLRAQVEDEKRRKEEYFALIDGACGERDKWKTMYHQQSLEHGSAQDMMMNVIEQLARKLEGLGHKAKIPAVIQTVRSDFFSRHVEPQKESEKEGVEKAPPQA